MYCNNYLLFHLEQEAFKNSVLIVAEKVELVGICTCEQKFLLNVLLNKGK